MDGDPRLADELIDGKHPIHYLCDKVFDGTVASGGEVARVLIAAGAYIDFASGDPLNAAASLGVLDVAFALLDAGADATPRGPFAGAWIARGEVARESGGTPASRRLSTLPSRRYPPAARPACSAAGTAAFLGGAGREH
ncbi:MAG TPA: hypothetical protein VEU30_08330 [Thermoanaerobaculia bacterium]|nr:hypothetical protein [Thermoanaerobaculia bacterium]